MLFDSENALKLICALVIALSGALWFMSFRFRQLKRVENANQNRGLKSAPKKPQRLYVIWSQIPWLHLLTTVRRSTVGRIAW
jgi:chloramphenicol O-acetyltransferase